MSRVSPILVLEQVLVGAPIKCHLQDTIEVVFVVVVVIVVNFGIWYRYSSFPFCGSSNNRQ